MRRPGPLPSPYASGRSSVERAAGASCRSPQSSHRSERCRYGAPPDSAHCLSAYTCAQSHLRCSRSCIKVARRAPRAALCQISVAMRRNRCVRPCARQITTTIPAVLPTQPRQAGPQRARGCTHAARQLRGGIYIATVSPPLECGLENSSAKPSCANRRRSRSARPSPLPRPSHRPRFRRLARGPTLPASAAAAAALRIASPLSQRLGIGKPRRGCVKVGSPDLHSRSMRRGLAIRSIAPARIAETRNRQASDFRASQTTRHRRLSSPDTSPAAIRRCAGTPLTCFHPPTAACG